MKLSIVLTRALAATTMAAPYSRCVVNGRVVDCNKMAKTRDTTSQCRVTSATAYLETSSEIGLERYAEKYYKARPEEVAKLNGQKKMMENTGAKA
ncbi:uncharacterized protein BDR25DRAFT_31618 [Lindgomyces ingoldianus]|uniref:Uncharacterized protein n=1 Tax=Lindgomyces ingoldianus TaxID=673940 RepID=A0ACB6QUW4_9PLEO|nr:uncharacterized protein BDR25DRAFT_31618 [Lindgomyces ingoldianus]KAF2470657.1 hypothetical protein BDR25DRAFT_31618 [Lindgomyces ingoldianus]